MRWTSPNNSIRKGFAWLPVTLCDGPTKETIWLRPYWHRFCGYYREVWFDEPPEVIAARATQEPSR